MACASDPNLESPTRQNQLPPSVTEDVAEEFKEGLPFYFNDRESLSQMKIST
jgi:hypothetical protein